MNLLRLPEMTAEVNEALAYYRAIEDDAVVLVALASMHRQPEYWRSRVTT